VIADNVITGNGVFAGINDERGGGLFLRGSDNLTVTGNVIRENWADYAGGGIEIEDCSNVWLVGNDISGGGGRIGGGIRIAVASIDIHLVGNTLTHNQSTAGGGGGLLIESSVVTLTNNVIADNSARRLGSGLHIADSTVSLLHNTIARNTAGDGSGLHVAGPDSTVALTNTVLVSHTVGITVAAGSTATLDATLWGADAWANLTDWDGAGTILTGTINIWGDPAFVDPDAGDYHILHSSAATDTGIQTSVVDDIDGDARPMCLGLSGCQVDLGADEYFIWKIYLPLVLNDFRQSDVH
jgi:hypothetical protein